MCSTADLLLKRAKRITRSRSNTRCWLAHAFQRISNVGLWWRTFILTSHKQIARINIRSSSILFHHFPHIIGISYRDWEEIQSSWRCIDFVHNTWHEINCSCVLMCSLSFVRRPMTIQRSYRESLRPIKLKFILFTVSIVVRVVRYFLSYDAMIYTDRNICVIYRICFR